MTEAILAITLFTTIILVLTLIVLGARRLLVPTGQCIIEVNGRKTITASIGQRLLDVLTHADILLPSACGGSGTCGLCKAVVVKGACEPGPQELAQLSRTETAQGVRLACQVSVLNAMKVEVGEVYFGVKTWQCSVLSVRNIATLICEIVLKLPNSEQMKFRPGSFIQVTCPPYQLSYSHLKIDKIYRDVWDKSRLWSLKASTSMPITRAYSMANKPGINDRIYLNVRIALPPPGSNNVAPGVVSSWLFSLKPEDKVDISGPYGNFFVQPTNKEIIFIGGGVGMAPLYAQILDLLETRHCKQRISYWYGARSKRELYYVDTLEQLQSKHENFKWYVVLSDPEPQDHWQGLTGIVHQAIFDQYLANHLAPDDCEYFLCGPPLMIKAVLAMLDEIGVDPSDIYFDDFGG